MAQKTETKPTVQIYICMSGLKLMLCSVHYKHVNESKHSEFYAKPLLDGQRSWPVVLFGTIRFSCSKRMGAVQTLLLCLHSYFHFFDGKCVLILNWTIPINHMLCSVFVGPIPPLPPHPNLHLILSSLPHLFCLLPFLSSFLLLVSWFLFSFTPPFSS